MQDETIQSYLDALGHHSPTPGGGAAAALTLAQSCALYCMALNVTFRDLDQPIPLSTSVSPVMKGQAKSVRDVVHKIEDFRWEFIVMGNKDMAVFTKLMDAYQRPKSTEKAKAARQKQIQKQTMAALDVSLQMAKLGVDVVTWGQYAVYLAKPNIISDSAIATELLVTGVKCALINAKINLKSLDDVDKRQQKSVEIQLIEDKLLPSTNPLREYCQNLLG